MGVFQFNQESLHYRYYIYCLFCQDSGGAGYVKFGRSRRIDLRISQLRVGCPIPIKMVGLLELRDEDRQKRTEKALHQYFKGRKVRGEWFAFDFKDPDDKRAFNEGCKKVFVEHLGKRDEQYWSTINMKALDAENSERRRWFLSLPENEKRRVAQRSRERAAVTCR